MNWLFCGYWNTKQWNVIHILVQKGIKIVYNLHNCTSIKSPTWHVYKNASSCPSASPDILLALLTTCVYQCCDFATGLNDLLHSYLLFSMVTVIKVIYICIYKNHINNSYIVN